MACDPIRVNIMMKKLAGFHSFDFVAARLLGSRFRRNLGIRDVHIEDWASFGREFDEVDCRRICRSVEG